MKAEILLNDVSKNRDKWLELKKTTIGSSEIATVCNINPYQSRLNLWAIKTGRIEPEKENDAMRYGTFMEPFIGKLFAEREQKKVIKPDIMYKAHCAEWATATPDFFSTSLEVEHLDYDSDLEIVECKTVRPQGRYNWQDGNIPNYAHSQTIWQLGVLGMESAKVAALIGGNTDDFITIPVTFSKELFEQMLDIASQFMEMIKSDTPPDVSNVDVKTIERMYAVNKDLIDLNDKNDIEIFNLYKTYNEERKNFDKLSKASHELEDYYRAQLLKLMKGHMQASVGSYIITNKLIKKQPYQVSASEYFDFRFKKLLEE